MAKLFKHGNKTHQRIMVYIAVFFYVGNYFECLDRVTEYLWEPDLDDEITSAVARAIHAEFNTYFESKETLKEFIEEVYKYIQDENLSLKLRKPNS